MKSYNQFYEWLRTMVRESKFANHYPHLEKVFRKIIPCESSEVYAMAVSKSDDKFFLFVNPDYFIENKKYFRGVLAHELLHVMLSHHDARFNNCFIKQEMMQVACELSVNELIPSDELPPEAIQLPQFMSIPGIYPGQSTIARYLIFKNEPQAFEVALSKAAMQGNNFIMKEHNNILTPTEASVTLEDIISEIKQEKNISCNKKLIEELIEEKEENILFPVISHDSEIYNELFLPPERMNGGTAALVKAIQQNVPCRSDFEYSYRKMNRRHADKIGIVPGKKRNRKNITILVGIDTSASMTEDEFIIIERELRNIRLVFPFLQCIIIECDTCARRTYPYTGVFNSVQGRGGTDLADIFNAETLLRIHPSFIVVFTDGLIKDPISDPKIPTVWALTKTVVAGLLHTICPFGEIVLLDEAKHEKEEYL